MSDITIPGFSNQNSTIDTEQVIRDLLELERAPIVRTESQISQYEQERAAWLDIGRRITQLADSASFLFGFQNPFNDRVGISSNEQALAITATRGADEARHTIEIVQNANRDRFRSQEIARDYRVAPGRYRFAVGDNEIIVNFDGGSLRELAAAISSARPEWLTAQVVRASNTADTILFESQLYGQDNRLLFKDDALSFAQEHGIVRYRAVQTFTSDEQYIVPAQTETRIPLTEQIGPDDSSTLRFSALLEELNPDQETGGFALPSSGSITLEGVTVPNLLSAVPLSEPEAVVVDNEHPTFVYAELASGGERALADLTASVDAQTIRVSLADITEPIAALIIRNDNTHQQVTIADIAINNEITSEYQPVHPIDQARDAIITIDGVTVTRASNTIDDLIPRATIELRAEQSAAVAVEITPDYEHIENSVLGFVANYNQLIRDLNILAKSDDEIINEIEYFTEEERAAARGRLGLMQGETTLTQLRNRLVTLTQNSYPTSADREINLLSQVGIATNVGGGRSGGFNPARLRGYLEFDQSQFDNAIRTNFAAVRELFGNDTDRDLVVDSGVAYQIDAYATLYTQNGGIVQIRVDGLDGRISRGNDRVTTYNERLEEYEQKLRNDFGRMQGALKALDDTTRSLDALRKP